MEENKLVALHDIVKIYHMGDVDVHALQSVSLSIAAGEFTAIMGASGSGKSTMMNIIGCLDRPTSGAYILAGHTVSGLNRDQLAEIRNSMLGFVFQNFNLLPRTTALENVELPMLYAGSISGKERRRRAEEALDRVGLANRMHHFSNQMSGGQQQRVAIARAIVCNPKILLADEPTGNLDTHSSEEIMHLFQQLGASGITIVLVTHEHDIADYASRVIIMRDGNICSDQQQSAKRATVPIRQIPGAAT